jgi:chemotaxis protein histidine kinase CheA
MDVHVNPIEGEFQEEVLRVFALEALEWIRQIKVSLLELEGSPDAQRAPILYESIRRNLTNLKGSAATVDLPSMGNLAFMLVPLLQHMQKDRGVSTWDYSGPLQQGLGALSSVIQVLAMAETKGLVVGDLESITRGQADALQNAVTKARSTPRVAVDHPESDTHSVETGKIVAALLPLKRARSFTSVPIRKLAEHVLRKVHAAQEIESSTVPAVSLSRIMHELREADDRFLEEMRQRSAAIQKVLGEIKTDSIGTNDYQLRIRTALREIAFLYPFIEAVDATEILEFLHGLETVLANMLYKQITVPTQAIEAVRTRLTALGLMAQEWADASRKELVDLEKIFTELMGKYFNPQSSASSTTPPK